MRSGRFVLAALAVFLVAACDDRSASPEIACGETPPPRSLSDPADAGYLITVDACVLDPTHIAFTIDTNLPLPVDIVAGVNLADTPPENIYVGHAETVRIEQATTVYVLDLTRVEPSLPAGDYEARVAFFNRSGGGDTDPLPVDTPDIWAVAPIVLEAQEPIAPTEANPAPGP